MDEKLKIIISAEIGNLKQNIKQATEQVKGFSQETKKHGEAIEKMMKKVGESAKKAGQAIGKAISRGAKVGAVAIGTLATASVKAYADFEQLTGGVETLFGKSADTVKKYASEAYKTAGMSANKYMETTTSFSASLLQSLGGDTAKAAEYANQAVIDMSDNANKMGTSMESIQNAYQGFAKGNFTMLDNLKLGYGGTKGEMERLVKDAAKIDKSIDANSLSFGNITKAIHAMQTEMGITGTTALEAEQTISGSLSMVKASFQNLLVGVADENANFHELIQNFTHSVEVAFKNLLPRVSEALYGVGSLFVQLAPILADAVPQILDAVLPNLLDAIAQLGLSVAEILPSVLESIFASIQDATPFVVEMIANLLEALVNSLPVLITGVVGLVNEVAFALSENMGTIMDAVCSIIPVILNSLLDNIPALLSAALELFYSIVEAIPIFLPELMAQLPIIIEKILDLVVSSIPELLDMAVFLFTTFVDAIPIMIPVLVEMLPQIINSIIDAIIDALPLLLSAGVALFLTIAEAIPKALPEIIRGLGQIVSAVVENLVNKLKDVLHFDWKLPDVKMPHFAITPRGWKVGDLLKGDIPKLSVDWYARGGVFDKPTLFNYGNGSIGGLGEAGAEAIVPLENNTKWLDKIADKLAGNGSPIILQVDGKTFAEICVDGINNLTRQSGTLPLVIA